MEQSIFYQLSLVLVLGTALAFVFRAFKQPLILAYIITGFLAGPVFGLIHNHEAFESFSQIGIVLLLFIVGLGLNTAVIRSTGKPVLLTFLVNALGLGTLAGCAAALMGYSMGESLIIATALLFSSTIIVVKSLSDKREQARLYAQLLVGVLLLEDVVATVALLGVSAAGGGTTSPLDFALLGAKAIGLATLLIVTGAYIMPRLSRMFAASQELLYVFALAWAFGVASLFWWAGFSIEVGALFAGVSLAHLPYAQGIGNKLKPLRDFFIVLFFISLGQRLALDHFLSALIPALIFSAVIMFTKPLLTMLSLGLMGYTKQTGFKAASHLSQISEFSIILVVLASTTGLISQELTVVIALTALITIGLSTYLMQFDDHLYHRFQKYLSAFERPDVKRELLSLQHYPLVLFGYHDGGYEFVRTFRKMKKPYVVIDYDPDVIEVLGDHRVDHIYGDATDPELLDEIGIHKSELLVSTIPDFETNKILLEHIMKRNRRAIFICHATSYDDAEALYKHGAAYVIMPHFIGNEQINDFIQRHGTNRKAFDRYRHRHLLTLGTMALK
jgi:Kef-type K+ transport system membrane component KefB